MCGITALINPQRTQLTGVVDRMTDLVAHRGPDGRGVFLLPPGERDAPLVALGHRRLSIIDTSAAGSQPMQYGEDLWITYNGEVYNYVELRAELASLGHRFHSSSDTEVVLAAYAEWGTGCFARFHGMWGLALLDVGRRVVVVSRDRLGIKPLYLAGSGDVTAIVSEIKQLRALPTQELRPDASSLAEYLQTGHENPTCSFFTGVAPLPPGTWIEIAIDTGKRSTPQAYWDPIATVDVTDPALASRAFTNELVRSVELHMRSDVPVGCALSGGLDSSAVAALVSPLTESGRPLQAFTVTFPGTAIDESAHARAVAQGCGAALHEISPSAQDLWETLDRLLDAHDEPVGSSSQYAGYAVAQLTRAHDVPVSLNGQGGDEVLGGYWQSYMMALRQGARRHPVHVAGDVARAALPGGNRHLLREIVVMARRLRSQRESRWLPGLQDAASARESQLDRALSLSSREFRVFEIRELFLPRLLKWDDRNFMAHSVEGRYPFLDHSLIETSLTFAPSVLYDRGWTKVPLRRAMEGRLPESVVRRRDKIGFETPQRAWLSGPLLAELENLLAQDSPLWGFVDASAARQLLQHLRDGRGSSSASDAMFRLVCADRWMRLFSLDAVA